MKNFVWFGLAALALILSACASLIEGPIQEISVTTNPPAASCVFQRQGVVIAGISPTPGQVTIGKTRDDITVACNKDGYKEARHIIRSESAVNIPLIAAGPYRLESGDTVRVIVYNQQSLSTDYKVGDNGTISLPLLGEVKARSLTEQELQKEIYDRLNNGIFVNPGVSVEVSQYRPIFVVGEVTKPGQYTYTPGINVLGAVAVAGGFTVRADARHMTMVRKQQGNSAEAAADPLTEILPGDVVVIHEHFF